MCSFLDCHARINVAVLSSLTLRFFICSAYNIFFKEERQKIMSHEHKSVGFQNLAKTIGARWKRMSSDEERAPYKEKAAVSFSWLGWLQRAFVLI